MRSPAVAETIDLLDNIKELGFKQATLAGVSFGLIDLRIPKEKPAIIDKTQTNGRSHPEELSRAAY